MWTALLAILGVLLMTALFQQLTLRRRWKRYREEVTTTLAADPADLAQQHPMQLNAALQRVRFTEAVHADYLTHSTTIRDQDRASTEEHLKQAREATQILRNAIATAVAQRANRGIVTPSLADLPRSQEGLVGHE